MHGSTRSISPLLATAGVVVLASAIATVWIRVGRPSLPVDGPGSAWVVAVVLLVGAALALAIRRSGRRLY